MKLPPASLIRLSSVHDYVWKNDQLVRIEIFIRRRLIHPFPTHETLPLIPYTHSTQADGRNSDCSARR